jgi:hypothetical protein
MRILWINPMGTEIFDAETQHMLAVSAQPGTPVDVIWLPAGQPHHLQGRRAPPQAEFDARGLFQ